MRSLKIEQAAIIFFISLSTAVFAVDYHAKDYGVVGDGITDDGPAIQSAMIDVFSQPGEHTLVFEPSKQFYVFNIEGTYLFNLEGRSGITINGNGSEFLLDGAARFLHAKGSSDIILKNLSIDYKPLPFVEGTIVAVNQSQAYVDVRVDDYYTMPPLGGPTNDTGEQAYYGHIWYEGPNSLLSMHYWVKDMHESYSGSAGDRILRVDADNFTGWNKITVDKDRISLPVRGIAHMGGNHVLRFIECRNVDVENVNIWTAPWFAVGLTRNSGHVILRNVNVTPKPENQRIMSSWRDGIHVKSNYASLLFEDCRLEGMGDDAFNIATFMSTVKTVFSGNHIQIKQNYALNIVPYEIGDVVVVYDITGGKILGRTRVSSSAGFYQPEDPGAPLITLQLEDLVPGVDTECAVWNESSANPNTILRRCTIRKSCRFQSSVTIDKCDIIALSWFYGANIEGPLPRDVVVKNSRLYLGRGNDVSSVIFSTNMTNGGTAYVPKSQPISNVLLQNNDIDGNLVIKHSQNVSVVGNSFSIQSSAIQIKNSRNLLFRDNRFEFLDISSASQIEFQDDGSKNDSEVEISGNISAINLMKPFPHWFALLGNGSRIRYHGLPDALKPLYLENKDILGTLYTCYQLNLPLSTDSVGRICLEEHPYPNTTNLRFWSFAQDATCGLAVYARFPDGDSTELYQSAITTGIIQNHEVGVPDIDSGSIEIHVWSEEDAVTGNVVYMGGLELSTIATGMGPVQDNEDQFVLRDNTENELKVYRHDCPDSFIVIAPEPGGILDLYDLHGRLLKSIQMESTREIFDAGGLPPQALILTFKGKSNFFSRKILSGLIQ